MKGAWKIMKLVLKPLINFYFSLEMENISQAAQKKVRFFWPAHNVCPYIVLC